MTIEEKANVTQLLAILAAYYRQKLEDEVLVMYAEDLLDLDYKEVVSAISAYRRNPKNRMMPLPAQIREVLTPVVDPEAMAREIAGRCVEAISKFGWPQPEKAHAYIGDEGWSVIQSNGGWTYFCEQHGVEINSGQFFAQARDRVRDQIAFGRSGIETAYLEKKDEQGIKQIGSILKMKQIPGNQNEPA